MKKEWISIFILCLSCSVWGSSYYFPDIGAKASGMGNAFVSIADDPSAAFYNSAGLAFLDGMQIYLNNSMAIITDHSYQRAPIGKYDWVELETEALYRPTLAFTHHFGMEYLRFGFTVNAPFASITDWPDEGPQRYMIKYIRLTFVNIMPVVAWRARDNLSFGFSGGPVYGQVKFEVDLDVDNLLLGTEPSEKPEKRIPTKIDNKDLSYGFNFGCLYLPFEWMSLGFQYVSEVPYTLEGKIRWKMPPPYDKVVPAELEDSMDISLPQHATIGVSFRPWNKWTLAFDYQWMDWSVIKEFRFKLKKEIMGFKEFVLKKNWHDANTYRFGFEFRYSEEFSVRAGYTYDETPIKPEYLSLEITDRDKSIFHTGWTYRFSKNLVLDSSWIYYRYKDLEVTNSLVVPNTNGKHKTDWHLFSMGITYLF